MYLWKNSSEIIRYITSLGTFCSLFLWILTTVFQTRTIGEVRVVNGSNAYSYFDTLICHKDPLRITHPFSTHISTYSNFNNLSPMSGPGPTEPTLTLDPISEWRAWQALSIIYTVLLNRQIWRRWLLEHKCMEDRSLSQRFRPVILLEAVPTIHKPNTTTKFNKNPTKNQAYNPYNPTTMATLRTRVALLRARVEKGKEFAAEIERRMVQTPRIRYPTHFCHTCVDDGERVEVLLTKCGHRVCRTCLEYGVDENGIYDCSICFAPAEFVARSPLDMIR